MGTEGSSTGRQWSSFQLQLFSVCLQYWVGANVVVAEVRVSIVWVSDKFVASPSIIVELRAGHSDSLKFNFLGLRNLKFNMAFFQVEPIIISPLVYLGKLYRDVIVIGW